MSLSTEIETLMATLDGLNQPTVDLKAMVEGSMLSEDDMLKRLLQKQSGLPDNEVTQKVFHSMVYGKDDSESLDTVDLEDKVKKSNAIPDSSDIKKRLKSIVKQTLSALSLLASETARSTKDVAALIAEAVAVATASANQLATMPPQPAAAAFTLLTFNARVTAVANSYSPLKVSLQPLENLEILLPDEILPSVTSTVETLVSQLNVNLQTISSIKV